MGILVAPLAYLTVWELVHSNIASLLTGVLVICETGTLILSQYILLDPPLLCFVMMSTFCTARFINCRKEWVAYTCRCMMYSSDHKQFNPHLCAIRMDGVSACEDLWTKYKFVHMHARVSVHVCARVHMGSANIACSFIAMWAKDRSSTVSN